MKPRRHTPKPDGLLPMVVVVLAATVLATAAWAGLVALIQTYR